MSRFLTRKEDGTYLEEIESIKVCRWQINEVCCNDKSEYVADYPYPSTICESKGICPYFEKEDGIIEEENK